MAIEQIIASEPLNLSTAVSKSQGDTFNEIPFGTGTVRASGLSDRLSFSQSAFGVTGTIGTSATVLYDSLRDGFGALDKVNLTNHNGASLYVGMSEPGTTGVLASGVYVPSGRVVTLSGPVKNLYAITSAGSATISLVGTRE